MRDELFCVQDQVVLVSGGSRGIGRALAIGFLKRGAQVVITGRDAETLQQTVDASADADRRLVAKVCDVSQPEQIEDRACMASHQG